MLRLLIQRLACTHASPTMIAIRLLVGGIFFIEGVKKFLFAGAQWGTGRFAKIGFPFPNIAGSFMGGGEIVCKLLLLMGLLTRLGAILLLIDISVPIATTKLPILVKSGFSLRWRITHEQTTRCS